MTGIRTRSYLGRMLLTSYFNQYHPDEKYTIVIYPIQLAQQHLFSLKYRVS